MIFEQIKLGTCVIPPFGGILAEKSLSSIILVFIGHPQDQKLNLKVKYDLQHICYKVQ